MNRLAPTDPGEAYRRSEIDARIRGAGTAELVCVCLEQVGTGLSSALLAQERDDAMARSKGLTRALSALTALQMGIDRSVPIAGVLDNLYGSARQAVLASVVRFDGDTLSRVRKDFLELAEAFAHPPVAH